MNIELDSNTVTTVEYGTKPASMVLTFRNPVERDEAVLAILRACEAETAREAVESTSDVTLDFYDPLTLRKHDDRYEPRWVVQGDLREVIDFDGKSTNYEVERCLRDSVIDPAGDGRPPVPRFASVTFDSEYSSFLALCPSQGMAEVVRDAALDVLRRLADGEAV